MGNSQTKETRPSHSQSSRRSHQWGSGSSHGRSPYGDRHHSEGSRSHRSSGPDLSILGIGGNSDRDVATILEHRRETKQEREARRLEKERAARIKERERSMREEHVDGGYLVTQGVYTGPEDFNKAIVRQLMIERRLAPFWRGLNDFSDSWTEHQLMAAARGLPIPPPDVIPPELEYKNPPKASEEATEASDMQSIQHLTVPITSRSASNGSDVSHSSQTPHSLPSPSSPIASGTSSSPLFRSRAKTLASLTTPRHNLQNDSTPREIQLPRDPFVNGQPIEAYLYKDATECPICFLYYPPYLNRTRCCDQPICSECFVQIKRPDPHPPEHADSDTNAPTTAGETERQDVQDIQLVSEPAACPFCVQPEFGVAYVPPPFRRGLAYASDSNGRPNIGTPVSSTSSLSSATAPATGRRRATSLSATDPSVITTDKVRPDWAQKLANARAHAARRSAAATALHTAAYLMNSNGSGSDSRGFSIGRRGVMRRNNGGQDSPGTPVRSGSPALQAFAFLTDRRAPPGQETDSAEEGTSNLAPPRNSSRRSRMDDLEEMMMMEAIRLSLASEEERRKREEKELRKEAKRREKEAKKAEKMARRAGFYSNNASSSALDSPSDSRLPKVTSSSSSIVGEETAPDKGKAVERVTLPRNNVSLPENTSSDDVPSGLLEPQQSHSSSSLGPPMPREPTKPSHLRHVSSASSSFSSLVESMSEEPGVSSQPHEGTSSSAEPLFNFRSLAAVIGDEDKPDGAAEHVEDTALHPTSERSSSSAANTSAPVDEPPVSTPSTAVEKGPRVEESRECSVRKEVEARSVEVTDSRNSEITS
ncbi:protein sip5 [Aspergillus desertorum]